MSLCDFGSYLYLTRIAELFSTAGSIGVSKHVFDTVVKTTIIAKPTRTRTALLSRRRQGIVRLVFVGREDDDRQKYKPAARLPFHSASGTNETIRLPEAKSLYQTVTHNISNAPMSSNRSEGIVVIPVSLRTLEK